MIYVSSAHDPRVWKTDETWAIVRSMRRLDPRVTQVPPLAPTRELTQRVTLLKRVGHWDRAAFDDVYAPQFVHYIARDRCSLEALSKLMAFAADPRGETFDVSLVCFCADETMCHRAIIGGILQGMGASVEFPTGADYSRYYKIFLTELDASQAERDTYERNRA